MDIKAINQLLVKIDQYACSRSLSRKDMALQLGVPYGTYKKWFLKSKYRRIPPPMHIEKMRKYLEFQDGYRRVHKIKLLLLLLEDELGWFREGTEQNREIFREMLDLDDVGYISSLLTMLGEEEKFQRWLALSTNKFNFFGEKGGNK